MKIFLICSKSSYDQIPGLEARLTADGHDLTMPNSYDDPGMEARQKELGHSEHAQWKASMLRHSAEVIGAVDAVLVLNFDKNGTKNYIGGATFLEMYDAFRLGKKIFLYNDIPDGILHDEILGFCPIILQGDLSLLT
jgi:hypothetical protein